MALESVFASEVVSQTASMPTAEIVAIGSELLTPYKTDSNGLWLTEQLLGLGIKVKLKTIVGDDLERLRETLSDALSRSDVVITTGGLGPTDDDVTRQGISLATERDLVFRPELLDDLRERFKRWGREMPEINKRQAFVVDGAEILPNPNGSAVGMLLRIDGRILVALPGPPREMQPMFLQHVRPLLEKIGGRVVARTRILRVTGMGESAVDEAIAPIYRNYASLETSILFNRVEVEIHLSALHESAEVADSMLDDVTKRICETLGEAVYSTDGSTMEQTVGRLLNERQKTVATAESCTGGLISMRLTEVAGSSAYFMQGVVTYSNDAKIRILGVPESLISEFGAVSSESAEAMASGMLRLAGTDYAISVTGIAGPGGGTEKKPVGTVFIGCASSGGVATRHLLIPGDRELVRWRASQAALDLLRRQILRNGSGK